jgi:hypothetical protein
VCAFLAFPLLLTWGDVAERALRHVGAALGVASAAGQRLPDDFYESPMHSSYGLAFLVLFLGSLVLVARDAFVARDAVPRRRSISALAALAAVPLTLVVMAIEIGFDPQHLRYIAFPVALATSAFAVALRARVLAWTGVVLAAVTVMVSIAYFVPRPGGLAILGVNRGTDQNARWLVQGGSGGGDPVAFRYLDESVPAATTVALAVLTNTYLYPAWDGGLRRRVVFVPPRGRVPEDAKWLVVGPGARFQPSGSRWERVLVSPRGWAIFRRLG